MSHKVDISEVHDFSDDLQEASEDIRSSLIKVKKGIETIDGMSSFSGKAAKEAKYYFNDLHQTILGSFRGVFSDLEENLNSHLKTFSSNVDSDESAVIKRDYLQDVKEDINEVFDDLNEQDEAISETIQKVSDITSAAPPSFSDVSQTKKDAEKKVRELDEDLSSFTNEGEKVDTKEVLHQIEAVMNSAKTSEGKARFADFEGASQISELAKLNNYNSNKRKERMEMAEALADKLSGGKTLSYTEREILYQYIQNEELDTKDRAQVNEIAIFIEHDNEKLKEYINEEVLASEKSLEEEIHLLEKYLFAGNERPSDLQGDTGDRVRLRSYLDILKNHRTAINEVSEEMDWNRSKGDPLLARVEYANFEIRGDSQFSGYGHMESDITIDLYQDTSGNHGISREEFLDSEMPIAVRRNHSEIEYYYGQDAVTNRIDKEELDLEKEVDTMTGQFIGSQLLGMALNPVGNAAMSFGKFQADKNEKEQQLTIYRLEKTANRFNLEIQMNTRDVPGSTKNIQAQLHPTEETYEQIERWQAVHQEEPDFPYDGALIRDQDWNGMYELFHGDNDEEIKLNEDELNLYNYILDGTESDHSTVQKLINN